MECRILGTVSRNQSSASAKQSGDLTQTVDMIKVGNTDNSDEFDDDLIILGIDSVLSGCIGNWTKTFSQGIERFKT